MARRAAPEVNAGSMADIAFLLLIFFLVTTTIEVDSGIVSKLPPEVDEQTPPPPVKKKNIFQVLVNKDNQLLVEEELMELKDLTDAAVAFIDNGGGEGKSGCAYCEGERSPESSDNPKKAIVSLVNDRQATYDYYITVTNELVRAYTILRNRAATQRYGETYESMYARYKDTQEADKETPEYLELEKRLDVIRELYPRNLSEAEPQVAG
ncbi:biopolymer transporter ExbD [Nonlabens arenilitoris]|uniref:Biopolymer transporter ExbD n=1 Tax=Nonlabens arenilitoris TaxID=1217969 RepID=A0A2S7U965_9FLAO|nr:biopolymer transporter ExbD [Nonlabens arenilitoris]PQJ31157.1 biopolymer transporter ExbD [Nonlabens arenilitoris]